MQFTLKDSSGTADTCFVADQTDEQPAQGDDQRRADEQRPAFDFKLRLGTRESTAALADHATGELVQLQPIEWDPLAGAHADEDGRAYQTDSELQSIIVELANKIATPDSGSPAPAQVDPRPTVTPAPAPAPSAPSTPSITLRPMFRPESLAESVVRPEPAASPTPAPAPAAPVMPAAPPVAAPAPAPAPIPVIAWSPAPEPEPTVLPEPPAAAMAAPAAPAAPASPPQVEPQHQPPVADPYAIDPYASAAPAAPADHEAVAPSADPHAAQHGADGEWHAADRPFDAAAPRIYGLGDSRSVPVTPGPAPFDAAAPAAAAGTAAPAAPVGYADPYAQAVPAANGAPAAPAPYSAPAAQRPPTGPVAMTPVTPIPPIGGPSGSTPVTPPPMPPRQSLPPAGAPLQLAKVERRAEAPRTTRPVDFRELLGEQGLSAGAAKKRKKKRHPFRLLFKLVIVLGIIGAGLFFGKKYVLDMRWASDVKPYAEAIQERRGLDWERAVKVETLPMADYAQRLAAAQLDLDVPGLAAQSVEWRAMGLVGAASQTDLTAIGAAAVAERPAFYDPSSKKVYIVEDAVGQLREFALNRALVSALLDQHFDWSSATDAADPGVRLAIETLVDGDAISTAAALVDPGIATNQVYLDQQAALAVRAEGFVHDVPRYVVDVVGGSDAAAPRFSALTTPAERDALLAAWPATDVGVFDGVRPVDTQPITISTGASRGMMYWYYVLAGYLPEVDAWNAALAWAGDEVTVTNNCVSALVSTVDEPGRQRLLDALGRWQAAVGRSGVTVAAQGTERIRVDACDPISVDGVDVATAPVPSADVVPFGRASAELSAVALVRATDPTVQHCVVNAVRAFDVVPLIRAGSSADLDRVLGDINASCSAPATPDGTQTTVAETTVAPAAP